MVLLQSLAESFEALRGLAKGRPQYLDAWWVLSGVEDLGHGAYQALEQPFQALHIGQPLALGTVAELLVLGSLSVVLQGLQKQMGVIDHPFPLHTIGPLVVIEPGGECATGQGFFA